MFNKKEQGRWWDFGWQLIEGCTKISPACKNCWSLEKEARFGIPKEVIFHPERLDRPLKRKKPTSYAIWNDLFHESVPHFQQEKVFKIMEKCAQHVFIVLTKRPEIMAKFIDTWYYRQPRDGKDHPIKNIWLGVTAENHEQANKRIPILLDIPAAKHFVSIEPMLSKMYISEYLTVINESGSHDYGGPFSGREKLDWVIVGGESGHNARPMHPDWVRSIRDQCKEANVPYFFKQWGHWIPEDLWPEDCCLDMGKVLYVHDHNENYFPIGTKNSGRELDGQHHKEFPR